MPYIPTVWVDEVPDSTPVKYVITGDIEGEMSASATIETVTPITAGTPINATNLNKHETAIETAVSNSEAALLAAGVVSSRQGGSSTNWNTQGSNTYTPAPEDVICQAGAKQISLNASVSNTATITFPVAFTYIPIVLLTKTYDSSGYVLATLNIVSLSTTQCIVQMLAASALTITLDFYWMAIGE